MRQQGSGRAGSEGPGANLWGIDPCPCAGDPIVLVQSSPAGTPGDHTIAATLPALPTECNVLVAFLIGQANAAPNPTATFPAGWHVIIDEPGVGPYSGRTAVAWKVSDGTEQTVTVALLSNGWTGVLVVREVHGVDRINVLGYREANPAGIVSGNPLAAAAVTPSAGREAMILGAMVYRPQDQFSLAYDGLTIDYSPPDVSRTTWHFTADHIAVTAGSYGGSASPGAPIPSYPAAFNDWNVQTALVVLTCRG